MYRKYLLIIIRLQKNIHLVTQSLSRDHRRRLDWPQSDMVGWALGRLRTTPGLKPRNNIEPHTIWIELFSNFWQFARRPLFMFRAWDKGEGNAKV
jgi:hypothetical protein